ncbi:MAG: S-layer homology domain-containing protein, partial [Candidatus Melainabacteria bacterium]|nr:S-layer homology domain-containing protein [Candidatus Melainabacteria bacterium]
MWKPSTIFVSVLLVLDSFFVAYAVGLNSRHVLVVDPALAPKTPMLTSEPSQGPASETTVATVSAPGTAGTTHDATTQFTDLTVADTRLQSSLQNAAQSGILDPTQDQKFRPNDPVTRGDFTRWMVRVRQVKPINPKEPTYSDVPANNPYYQDIEGATKALMVQGYTVKDKPQKEFKLDQFITRQEFAVLYGTFSGKRGRAEKLSQEDIEKYLRYNPATSTFGGLTYKDCGDVDD